MTKQLPTAYSLFKKERLVVTNRSFLAKPNGLDADIIS